MKRVISVSLAALMLLMLTGCGQSGSSTVAANSASTVPTVTAEPVKQEEIIDDDVIKEKAPVVTVSGGDIQGYYSDDGTVRVYKGIPYAEAERFKAPTETSWDGVLDCTDWGASCVQQKERPIAAYTAEFMGSSTKYSEDCLNLNVWTGNDDETGKPVIVYFHGGGYTTGNASCKVYEGKGIAQKGCVYVGVNFRIGLFGFYANEELVKEDPTAAGNYAVLDWIASLKWVQENIEKFGGDPSNVTIMGQSAGAGAVNMLTISPLAKGLFKRVVSMSHNSVAGQQFQIGTQAEKVTGFEDAVAKYELPDLTLEEMRAMTDQEFYDAYEKIWFVDNSPCEPCIDGVVIPDSYTNVMVSGQANDVDIMVGTTSHDLGGKVEGLTGDLQVDAWTGETDIFAYAHAMGGYEGSTYTYIFTHAMPGKSNHGAFHTSDVPYFLNVFTKLRQEYWTDEDYELGDTMSDYLVNFATSGDPNGEGLPQWDANTAEPGKIDYTYMNLDITSEMKQIPDSSIALIETEYGDLIQHIEDESPVAAASAE